MKMKTKKKTQPTRRPLGLVGCRREKGVTKEKEENGPPGIKKEKARKLARGKKRPGLVNGFVTRPGPPREKPARGKKNGPGRKREKPAGISPKFRRIPQRAKGKKKKNSPLGNPPSRRNPAKISVNQMVVVKGVRKNPGKRKRKNKLKKPKCFSRKKKKVGGLGHHPPRRAQGVGHN